VREVLASGEGRRWLHNVTDADDMTIGEALRGYLSMHTSHLEAEGRYAEWQRAQRRYVADAASFLENLDEETRAAMKRRPVSRKQLSLIRYTCECFSIEFPALSDRWAAFEWLRDIGANPRCREVRT
jgi:hypothetical protein